MRRSRFFLFLRRRLLSTGRPSFETDGAEAKWLAGECAPARDLHVICGYAPGTGASDWTLSENRSQVLMELPPLLLPGHDEAVVVRLRFDARIVDGFLERLTSLRSMMLPGET